MDTFVTILVDWNELLDAIFGPHVGSEDLQPLLWVDTGRVTYRALLGKEQSDELMTAKRLLPIPTWNAAQGIQFRKEFANSLCDPQLRDQLTQALATSNPFEAFEQCLQRVPIELRRWQDEERLSATDSVCKWLHALGYTPDPPPDMERRILEFRRPSS